MTEPPNLRIEVVFTNMQIKTDVINVKKKKGKFTQNGTLYVKNARPPLD